MPDPAVRRIVVGVDGSAESAGALRWACREASLRGAEVHAVHVWEAPCHPAASYAASVPVSKPDGSDFDGLWQAVMPDPVPDVRVRAEVAHGLAARVLLERCAGADMLVLGTSGDERGSNRSAGPVIRACLRRPPCPVVVISAAQDPRQALETVGARVPAPATAGATVGGSIPIPVVAFG